MSAYPARDSGLAGPSYAAAGAGAPGSFPGQCVQGGFNAPSSPFPPVDQEALLKAGRELLNKQFDPNDHFARTAAFVQQKSAQFRPFLEQPAMGPQQGTGGPPGAGAPPGAMEMYVRAQGPPTRMHSNEGLGLRPPGFERGLGGTAGPNLAPGVYPLPLNVMSSSPGYNGPMPPYANHELAGLSRAPPAEKGTDNLNLQPYQEPVANNPKAGQSSPELHKSKEQSASAGEEEGTSDKDEEWVKEEENEDEEEEGLIPEEFLQQETSTVAEEAKASEGNNGKGYKKDKVCPECGYCTHSPYVLRTHVQAVHRKERSHVCQLCSKAFTQPAALRTHIKYVHERHVKQLVKNKACPVCEYKTHSNSVLRTHIASVHEKKRDYKCGECGKMFSQPSTLKTHLKFVHGPAKHAALVKDKYCELCDYRTHSHTVLQQHIQGKHNKSKEYHCALCNKDFAYATSYRRHVKFAHEKSATSKEAQAKEASLCNACGYHAESVHQLQLHVQSNHGGQQSQIRPVDEEHMCDTCAQPFTTLASLHHHIRAVHENVAFAHAKNHTCSEGPSLAALNIHVNGVHTKTKPYTCDWCGQTFALQSSLHTHVRQSHSKDHLFRCPEPECDYTSHNDNALQLHIEGKHHKKLDCQCTVCARTFPWPGSLLTHVRTSHPDVSYKSVVQKTANQLPGQ